MFKKVLIANRGEIGVRIVRTCREMGIETVAVYGPGDRGSLHVRLADQCVELDAAADYMNSERILQIARETAVDAIHPGYGFLAEETGFIRACETVGITFIGPPADVVETLRNKTTALQKAKAAGFPVVKHSANSFNPDEYEEMRTAAAELGYPLIIKSCSGGRGRGERLVLSPSQLAEAARQAQVEGHAVYGNRRVYLERAILPAYQVGVQILGDKHGTMIHLGEREGSMLQKGQKIVEEAPAVCISQAQRERLWETALELARLFNYENLGTVEFVVDSAGNFYFSEIKARIQVEHPLTEVMTRLDLVREQLRMAAGEPLPLAQEDVWLGGHAMLCRVRAEDPWANFLPGPGKLGHVRLPGGPEVRVDTYVYCGCEVPGAYDTLIAKLTVWAKDRTMCLQRLQRSIEDFSVTGIPTNLPLVQRMAQSPEFAAARYSTQLRVNLFEDNRGSSRETHLRDLAIATAVLYVRRNQLLHARVPERLLGGWHRESRRLPR